MHKQIILYLSFIISATVNSSEIGQIKSEQEIIFEKVVPFLDFKSKVCLGKINTILYHAIKPGKLELNADDCIKLNIYDYTAAMFYYALKSIPTEREWGWCKAIPVYRNHSMEFSVNFNRPKGRCFFNDFLFY